MNLRPLGRTCSYRRFPHRAADLLAPPQSDEEKGALGEAVEFQRDVLSDGPVASSDVQRQADEAGISGRTLTGARKTLHVRRFKEGSRWFLELKDAKSAKDANISTLENVADLEDGQPPQLGNLGDVGHVGGVHTNGAAGPMGRRCDI